FLADQAVAHRIEPGAAVLLGQGRAKQAERRHLRDQLDREPALVEALADDRKHALVGEARNAVLHRALLLAQQGSHVVQVVGMQGHGETSPGNPHMIAVDAPAPPPAEGHGTERRGLSGARPTWLPERCTPCHRHQTETPRPLRVAAFRVQRPGRAGQIRSYWRLLPAEATSLPAPETLASTWPSSTGRRSPGSSARRTVRSAPS